MKNRSVIIIGAGVGGLATAIQLAKAGRHVTVYEKTKYPGGRCQQIVKDGHVFDTGPTMYLFPHVYEDFFSSIGENIHDYLTLLPANPRYRLNFSDGTHFFFTSDMAVMQKQLEAIEPGSYRQFLKYLESGRNLYEMAMDRMMNKRMSSPWEYFTFSNLFHFLKHRALMPHMKFAKRYFRNPNLCAAFTFQDSYLSLNPYTAPAICSLFVYGEHAFGSFLPKGGMYQVVLALERIAKKYGVKIVYDTPVKRLIFKNKCATGVLLEKGTVTADDIVINADMTYAYSHLLPHDRYAETLRKKKRSCSAIIYHFSMDVVYPQLETHNLFFVSPYRNGFAHLIDRAKPPEETHFYVQAPTRTDATRAPKGRDTLSVMVPINHISEEHAVDWARYGNEMLEKVIEKLEQSGLTDFRKHITHESRFTPPDWQSHLSLHQGSIYGLHHGISQLGYLRSKRKHHAYENVFFVGADTHPGSSLPTVLRSSQFTSKLMLARSAGQCVL